METMKETLEAMNEKARAASYASITKGEFLKWLGIRLYMTLEPRKGGIAVYWMKGRCSTTSFLGADMESFAKMTRHRFEEIQSCISFQPLRDSTLASDVSVCLFMYPLSIALKPSSI
jgi:hypothetical protein